MKAKVAASVAAVAVLSALALTAGCTAGAPDRVDDKEANGDRRDTGRVLSTDQLRHAELGPREVPGFQIERASIGTAGHGRPRTDSAPCRPLVALLGSRPQPAPAASVVNTFAKAGDGHHFDGLLGTIRVSAYDRDGAAATLKQLRLAAAACADGFAMTTGEGEPQTFKAVQTLEPPSLGDEAVAYRLANAAEKAPSLVTVVRTGSNLALFFATSLSDPEGVEIPRELVEAQVGKVEKLANAERVPTAPPSPSTFVAPEGGEAGDSVE
ncbi:hypothetical protein ACFWAT_24890 [Streptomyces syringium]|uniref:hypothetical protein n=1 Tax=Streptomyces syringium TaxID=76729 RepID=UPI00365B4CA8